MKTDTHLYAIFRACPEYLFLLAGLPSPGPCKMEPVTIKAISRTMDGLVTPKNPAAPRTAVEFQCQRDTGVYCRLVIEMASLQLESPERGVQGLLFFLRRAYDTKTAPWTQVVRTVYLDEVLQRLERTEPDHPLVLVFKPVLERSNAVLVKQANRHYEKLSSALPPAHRETFEAVFVDWLMQRFNTKTRKELTAMIADFPPVEETAAGRELIEMGMERGGKAALATLLSRQVAVKFGRSGAGCQEMLKRLSPAKLNKLGEALLTMKRISELKSWLASS